MGIVSESSTKQPPRRLGRPRGGAPKEDRHEDVLSAAASLFRRRGYRATRLEEIADELGVTRAALYYYVHTKQELLEQICTRSMQTIEAALQEVRVVPDAADRLRAFATAFATNTATDAARVAFRDAQELRPEFRSGMRERGHRVTDGAVEIIEDGIASGRFRPVDAVVTASGLLSTLNALPDWVRPDRHGSLEEVTEQLLDVWLRGICVERE
jgi:AcrR family transcriptional regulator